MEQELTPAIATASEDQQRGKATLVGSTAASRDEAVAKRLWEVSEELTGVKYDLNDFDAWAADFENPRSGVLAHAATRCVVLPPGAASFSNNPATPRGSSGCQASCQVATWTSQAAPAASHP